MLSELKKVELPGKKESVKTPQGDYNPEQLLELASYIPDCGGVVLLTYKEHKVELRGVQEDFEILLDGKLVCDCIYDSIHNDNKELVNFLLK